MKLRGTKFVDIVFLVTVGCVVGIAGLVGRANVIRPWEEPQKPVNYQDFDPDPRFPEKPPRFGAPLLSPADSDVAADELVLGVALGGEARAYPLNMLSGPNHEAINDTLGGRPVAVTWCDFCHDGIVYSRELDGRVLTLVVSGFLWEYSMVLVDSETRSMWSQVVGRAMRGPLAGQRLERLPSVVTTWAEWRRLHPETQVIDLPREQTNFVRDFHMARHRFVIGVEVQGEAVHASFQNLAGRNLVNFELREHPQVITYDDETTAARVFSRVVRGKVLNFRPGLAGRMYDLETNSTWDAARGVALAGSRQGDVLEPQPAVVAYNIVWQAFHPASLDLCRESAPASDAAD